MSAINAYQRALVSGWPDLPFDPLEIAAMSDAELLKVVEPVAAASIFPLLWRELGEAESRREAVEVVEDIIQEAHCARADLLRLPD